MITLWTNVILVAFVGVLSWILGFIVFYKNYHSSLHQTFFIFTAGVGIWSINFSLLAWTRFSGIYDIWCLLGGILLSLGLFLFTREFGKLPLHQKYIHAIFIASISIAILTILGLVISDVTVSDDFYVFPHNGPFFLSYFTFNICLLFISIINLLQTWRISHHEQKQKSAYLFFSLITFILIAIVCNLILPFLNIPIANMIGPLASLIFIGGSAYAILIHDVIDIRIILERSIASVLTIIIIVFVYVSAVFIFRNVIDPDYNSLFLFDVAIACGLIFLIIPLERWLRMRTYHIIFHDTYHIYEASEKLFQALHSVYSVQEMQEKITATLSEIFFTSHVNIMIFSEDQKEIPENVIHKRNNFRNSRQGLLVVLENHEKIIGFIELGPRVSHEPYRRRDERFLTYFGKHMMTFLEKIQVYTHLREYSSSLEKQLSNATQASDNTHQKREFIMAEIAHALQTPLTLALHQLEQNRNTHTKHLQKAIMDISLYIQQLLHIARLGEPLAMSDKQPVHLSELLTDIIDEVVILSDQNNIVIEKDIAPNIWILGADRELRECFMNIFSNAIKYRDHKKESLIHLSLLHHQQEAVLEIYDNGKGISPDMQARLFTRFAREKNTDHPGNGLGMIICSRIVKRHKGVIVIESKEHEFTKVTLRFPLTQEIPQSSRPQKPLEH